MLQSNSVDRVLDQFSQHDPCIIVKRMSCEQVEDSGLIDCELKRVTNKSFSFNVGVVDFSPRKPMRRVLEFRSRRNPFVALLELFCRIREVGRKSEEAIFSC